MRIFADKNISSYFCPQTMKTDGVKLKSVIPACHSLFKINTRIYLFDPT